MKKISVLVNRGFDDIPTLVDEITNDVRCRFNNILNQVVVNYLGRPFDNNLDNGRFELRSNNENDNQELYADGSHLGTLKYQLGHNGEDFIKNKITYIISFTPVVKEVDNE